MTKKRVDANQAEIMAKYRELGFSVFSCAPMGKGFPDLVVGIYGVTDLVEVKDGPKKFLTKAQREFFAEWKGSARVVRDTIDVEEHLKELQNEFF